MRPVALLLLSCTPGFTGFWTGELTANAQCTGSDPIQNTGVVRWSIIETDKLTVTPEGHDCGSFTATLITRDDAQVDSWPCEIAGTTITITGGRMRLRGAALSVNLEASNPACTGTLSAELARQP